VARLVSRAVSRRRRLHTWSKRRNVAPCRAWRSWRRHSRRPCWRLRRGG